MDNKDNTVNPVWTTDVTPSYVLRSATDTEWRCQLFGTGDAMTLHRSEGDQPNWFWRKMQYLILGNKWIKSEEK